MPYWTASETEEKGLGFGVHSFGFRGYRNYRGYLDFPVSRGGEGVPEIVSSQGFFEALGAWGTWGAAPGRLELLETARVEKVVVDRARGLGMVLQPLGFGFRFRV